MDTVFLLGIRNLPLLMLLSRFTHIPYQIKKHRVLTMLEKLNIDGQLMTHRATSTFRDGVANNVSFIPRDPA